MSSLRKRSGLFTLVFPEMHIGVNECWQKIRNKGANYFVNLHMKEANAKFIIIF